MIARVETCATSARRIEKTKCDSPVYIYIFLNNKFVVFVFVLFLVCCLFFCFRWERGREDRADRRSLREVERKIEGI